MISLSRIVTIFFICYLCISRSGLSQNEWQEVKSTHFLIYAQTGIDPKFTQAVLFHAEKSYDQSVRYFGSLPQKNFWIWENRCKIYLYQSKEEYRTNSKQPEWSGGFSIPSERTIVSYQNAPNFLQSVLPHEMAHLIFREFVGFKNGQIPRWLDEGFAVWQEQGPKDHYNIVVKRSIEGGTAIPLLSLNKINLLQDKQTLDAELFYSQAQSTVHFLLEKHDPAYFIDFCRLLRDGADFEEAFRKSYKHDFSTLNEFEEDWKLFAAG